MTKKDIEDYMRDAHMRFILDRSDRNDTTIKNRKTYIFSLFAIGLVTLIVTRFFLSADFKVAAFVIICCLIYFFGKEVGNRNGYIMAYKSLPEYDEGYLIRWKDARDRQALKSEVSAETAKKNVETFLKGSDFSLSTTLLDDE